MRSRLLRTTPWVAPVLAVFFVCLYAFWNADDVTPLAWNTYTESAHEQTGYLALLHSEQASSSLYIAIDAPLDSANLNLREGWSLNVIDESVQWNPRVCAKTPSTVIPGGDMFMYDTRRLSAGSFDSYFVRYDTLSQTLYEARVDYGEFVGKTMFRKETQPYFLEKRYGRLYQSTYDALRNTLVHTPLRTLRDDESVTVALSDGYLPLIELYDGRTLRSTTYTLREAVLAEDTNATIAKTVAYPDTSHSEYDLGNGFRARYNLSNPYETSIFYGDTIILAFLPEEKIYSYAVGSFTSP